MTDQNDYHYGWIRKPKINCATLKKTICTYVCVKIDLNQTLL